MSINGQGYWDFRSVCEICRGILSRTCKPPADKSKSGQGRPFGAWLKQGDVLGADRSSQDHSSYVPDLEARHLARAEGSGSPDAASWLAQGREIRSGIDGADGEPINIP